MMMAMHAKDYYVAPIYPALLAAGAVALGALTRRSWPPIVYTVILGYLLCRVTAPIMLTILPPDKYTAYATHFVDTNVKARSSPAHCRNTSPTASAGRRWSRVCRTLRRSAA